MIRPDDAPFKYVSFAAAERERLELLPADTSDELERTARLLCGDLTVEPKGGYNVDTFLNHSVIRIRRTGPRHRLRRGGESSRHTRRRESPLG